MRSWKIHILALGIVALIALFGLQGIQKTVGRVHTDHTGSPTASVELTDTATIGQVFIAEYDGLCSVAVKLENPAEHNDEVLTFHLQESPSGGYQYAVLDMDTSEIDGGSNLTFEFPSIRHSANESFYFILEMSPGVPEGSLSVMGSAEDTYPHGEAVLEGFEVNLAVRDLAFRIGYDPPLIKKVEMLLDRIVANKPSIWGDKSFYIALALAHLALIYVLFVRVVEPHTEEKKHE